MKVLFSPRKPIPSVKSMIKEGEREYLEELRGGSEDLEEVLASEEFYHTQGTSDNLAVKAFDLKRELDLEYSAVLGVLKKHSEEKVMYFAEKAKMFGQDFEATSYMLDNFGYQKTRALVGNQIDLKSFKGQIDSGEISPVKIEKPKGDLVCEHKTESNPYTVVYLLTKQFLDSEGFKGMYGTKENLNREMQLVKVENTINHFLETYAGANVSYSGTVPGFPVVFPKDTGEVKEPKMIKYTPRISNDIINRNN